MPAHRVHTNDDLPKQPLSPQLITILLGASVLVFGLYQFVEDWWLVDRVSMRTLHFVHLLRGIGSSFLLALIAGWYVWRRQTPAYPVDGTADAYAAPPEPVERLLQHALWFIDMRWAAGVSALALSVLGGPVLKILPRDTVTPLVLTSLAILASNLAYQRWLRSGRAHQNHLVVQILVDLVLLTVLLHFSGGLENPFFVLYVFHVIIAGILLPKRTALVLTLVACGLLAAMALGELFEWFDHYTVGLFPHPLAVEEVEEAGHVAGAAHLEPVAHAAHQPYYVLGRLLPFLGTLMFTWYLMSVIADRLARREEQLAGAARAAYQERQKLEGVVRAVGAGLVLLDREGTLVWFNEKLHAWFGWDRAAVGRPAPPPFPLRDRGDLPPVEERALQDRRPVESELALATADRVRRRFHLTASPILGADGSTVQVAVLLQDATARRTLEAQAAHASRMALLGRMAAGIAHEIGNPLSSLKTRLDLLGRNPDPAFQKESLAVLSTQIDRMARIVQGVTQFARHREGGWGAVDLNGIVREAVDVMRLDRRSRGLRFELALAERLPPVAGVRDQLQQVVINLVLNGVEASPEGGRLDIGTRAVADGVDLVVADRGPGLDPENQVRIFEPFFSTKEGGTGLGLAICYGIVTSHGGRIQAGNRPGGGARFAVHLPAAEIPSLKE